MKYTILDLCEGRYKIVEISTEETVFIGSLPEVNAWIELQDKGYDI